MPAVRCSAPTRGIAHDFNNLPTVVLANFEMIERGVERVTPIAAGTIRRRAAEECENLTRQLLTSGESAHGRMENADRLGAREGEFMWIAKPYRRAELAARIRQALQR